MTDNPTIELTLNSGGTITTNAYANAGDAIDQLKIPVSTVVKHRVVEPAAPTIYVSKRDLSRALANQLSRDDRIPPIESQQLLGMGNTLFNTIKAAQEL